MSKPWVKAKEVMTSDYIIVDGLSTVADALDRARRGNIETLIVDKRDHQDEYGIVLLSDIAKRVIAQDKAPQRVNLYEIMTKPVLSVAPDMDVRYVARLFERFGISLAPVIEQDKVLGIVSYKEIVLNALV